MAIKIIAIGNILMGDDGVGIRIGEKIKNELKKINIEVIIAETDFQYCVSRIQQGDFLFLLDASIMGKKPGEITVIPIENYIYKGDLYSQHGCSLLTLINLYKKEVKGYIIAIEVEEIKFSLNLSTTLESKLNNITEEIIEIIKEVLKCNNLWEELLLNRRDY
ncbi:hydrogenase maturation protease [Clostridium lundense]|uniref:hydrogenase maturation protease n=1 Tax=Clostridium lundense TaxID=319475 RepID=UPI0006846389|nr:hydrogenase maturation protease [Clostridium lundense]